MAAGKDGVTIALASEAAVAGRVVAPDGRPVRSFRVNASWVSRSAGGGEVMSSATRMIEHAEGRFELDHLEPTRMLALGITTVDGATGHAEPFGLAPGERKDDLRIEVAVQTGRLRGRLLDRATGKPALGLMVFFVLTSSWPSFPVDGEGRFEARVPAGTFSELNVMSQTGGYPPIARGFEVKPGEVTDLGDLMVELR